MAASDFLKSFRNSSDKPKETENQTHTRSVSLTDDEKGYFKDSQPGEEVMCQVSGKLQDGKLSIMSISPMNQMEEQTDEKEMAGQVAGKISPNV